MINKFIAASIIFISPVLAVLITFSTITFAYYLPVITSKNAIVKNNDQGLILLDRNGREFFSFYNAKNRDYVALNKISTNVTNAAIASEDRDFYHHHGISFNGIARSVVLDIKNRSLAYGGSTITQQLVKNTLLSPNRNLFRKAQEITLALGVEKYYKKNEILEMYLNTAYFGNNVFGIQDAAKYYFGKNASDLTVPEAAYLVGLLPAPTQISEDANFARERELIVLSRMQNAGYINGEGESQAEKTKLAFVNVSENLNTIAPHFAIFVRNALIQKFGENQLIQSGLVVKTTLDLSKQQIAEDEVHKQVANLARNGVTNGAAVALDAKTGEILAMVGSVDWNNDTFGKMNLAVTPRQTGSSFKPIVYATALDERLITPATILKDVPTTFKIPNCQVNCTYKPQDYDRKYRGNVTVRRALASSLNIPSVEVMEKVGVREVLSKAKDDGITTLGDDASKYGPSLVLGTGEISLLELTNAYQSFANHGEYVEANYIKEIKDKRGNTIDVAKAYTNNSWSAQVAYLISSILSDNRTRAEEFGNTLTISRPAAVKTGTTEDFKDAWTVGYTPDVVVGVWVGNNDNRAMDNIAGSLGAAPIWRDLMENYNRGLAVKDFEPPDGIAKVPVCSNSSASSSARFEYFIDGTQPNCFAPPNIAQATSSASFVLDITPPATPSSNFVQIDQTMDNNSTRSDHGHGRRGIGGGP